jgi:hypothetical protein
MISPILKIILIASAIYFGYNIAKDYLKQRKRIDQMEDIVRDYEFLINEKRKGKKGR